MNFFQTILSWFKPNCQPAIDAAVKAATDPLLFEIKDLRTQISQPSE